MSVQTAEYQIAARENKYAEVNYINNQIKSIYKGSSLKIQYNINITLFLVFSTFRYLKYQSVYINLAKIPVLGYF